jgi:hypothetical protein
VEQEKQKKVLDDILKHSHVTVAENFQVKMPELHQPQGLPPGFAPGGQDEPQPVEPTQNSEKPKATDSSKKDNSNPRKK